MARETVEVLVDDLDGSEAIESVRLGWNGEWRELELSEKNLSALAKALDRFWDAGRPVSAGGQSRRRRARRPGGASRGGGRDPKAIRAWALQSGIAVPSRGRIPATVIEQYERANRS